MDDFCYSGCIGTLFQDVPSLQVAHIRPYVIAILLHRGAVRSEEVMACLIPHCSTDDIREGAWDELINDYRESSKAKELIDEVLGEMTIEGLIRYNKELDIWVLTPFATRKAISWVAETNGMMPYHLLVELSKGDSSEKT
jgi:hypothetical protein